MAFSIELTSTAPPGVVWDTVTDFARHADHVPATTIRTDSGSPRLGWGFVAATGLGPVTFDDPMVITAWDPPHHVRILKLGRLLHGWADITVEPRDGGGTRLTWTEQVAPAVGARLLGVVSDRVGTQLFRRVAAGLLADAESAAAVLA